MARLAAGPGIAPGTLRSGEERRLFNGMACKRHDKPDDYAQLRICTGAVLKLTAAEILFLVSDTQGGKAAVHAIKR
jgi:hypothetical protein